LLIFVNFFAGVSIVAASNVPVTIIDTQFTNHNGTAALSIAGGQVSLQRVEFTKNVGTFVGHGAGLEVTASAIVAIQDSTFKSNVKSIGEGSSMLHTFFFSISMHSNLLLRANPYFHIHIGAGIHCENSHMTIGTSNLQYNKAPAAGAASCSNCVVVSFGNTNSRNTGTGPDQCEIGQ
jgi:hypothetical protein